MIAKIRNIFKNKIVIIVLSAVLVITGSVVAFIEIGEARLRKQLSFDDQLSAEDAYGDTAEVFHNGQGYVYNDNLINILCIGVDKYEMTDKRYRQADALYLMSLDTETRKLNILAISRNTLTDIDVYDMDNEFMDTENAQICLSYVYGKDDEHSCLLTSKAVSRLLYNIPINSYYTIFLDGIATLVDSVGGVTVTLSEDMSFYKPDWKKGSEISLQGADLLRYLQYRGENSNQFRMERHLNFIKSFYSATKKEFKKNLALPVELYKKVAQNSVTNIDISQVAYLATEISNANVEFHSIEGKSGFDGLYETFEANEEALYEKVLNLFYIKTN